MSLCPINYGVEYDMVIFLEELSQLQIYLVPPAIILVLWKVFVTTPRARVLVLGLDDSSESYLRWCRRQISGWRVLMYLFTSVLTFSLGAFAFDVYRYFMGLISSLAVWKFHW